jgi:hypothetical protein
MKRFAIIFLSLLLPCTLFAQSNKFVDDLLASKQVNVGQAALLVLVASDNLGEDADSARAFELLENLGWAPKGKSADSPLKLSEYAYMLMRAFGLKGGVLYSIFPSPRYAYRELASKVVIQGRSDPDMAFDGTAAIRMLGRIFDIKGVAQ